MEKFTPRKSKQIRKPFDPVKTEVKISGTIFTAPVFYESAHMNSFTPVITWQSYLTFFNLRNI